MQDYQNDTKKELESVVAHLKKELTLIHATRANPVLVEDIAVSVYGQKMKIKELASLSTPDAKTLVIQPWDTGVIQELQKAIQNSNLGMSMAVEEKYIRLTMPQLSEERRHEVLKVLRKKIEEARISVRRVRDAKVKAIEEAERTKSISEDEKFRSKEKIQKLVDEVNLTIKDSENKKATEIGG
jgi:ribosome recycling factor